MEREDERRIRTLLLAASVLLAEAVYVWIQYLYYG